MIAHASHSYTLASHTSQSADQNLPKSMLAQTHREIADLDKTKISADLRHKWLKINKAQHLIE